MRDGKLIVRVSEREKELYQAEADRRHMLLSSWVRMLLMDEITRVERSRLDRTRMRSQYPKTMIDNGTGQ